MLLNSYVGVSCSASWIKAVEIEHRRGVVKQVKAHAVPLPLGCIDERFGNIEDSQSVRLALQGISLLTPNFIRTCQISIALPRQCSYTAAWCIPGLGRRLNPEEIRQRCEDELPGRFESLCVDAHQRCDPANGTVQVMLVAVKRDVLEGYRRIFTGARRYVVRVTTDEISRYNVVVQCDRAIRSQKVMLLWVGKERAEIAVWDCGVRIAGCSISAERRLSSHYTQPQAKPEFHRQAPPFGDRIREIAIVVEKLLADGRDSSKSIERVVCWGPLFGERLAREAFEAMLPSQPPVSWLEHSLSSGSSVIGGASVFDSDVCTDDYNEALGAVLPECMRPDAPQGRWRKNGARVSHREPKPRWTPGRFVEGGI